MGVNSDLLKTQASF